VMFGHTPVFHLGLLESLLMTGIKWLAYETLTVEVTRCRQGAPVLEHGSGWLR
jgi:hypothetical protein